MAPGFINKLDKMLIFVIPGVPHEAQKMIEESIIPYILNNYKIKKEYSSSLRFIGLSESFIYTQIKPILTSDIFYRSYPCYGEVGISLSGKKANVKRTINEIETLLKDYIYTYDNIKV